MNEVFSVKDLLHEAPNAGLLAWALYKIAGIEANQRLVMQALHIAPAKASRGGALRVLAVAAVLGLGFPLLTGCTVAKGKGWAFASIGTARQIQSLTMSTNGTLRIHNLNFDPGPGINAAATGAKFLLIPAATAAGVP